MSDKLENDTYYTLPIAQVLNHDGFVTIAAREPSIIVMQAKDWRFNREVPFILNEGGKATLIEFAGIISNWADLHPERDSILIDWTTFLNELVNSTLKNPGPAIYPIMGRNDLFGELKEPPTALDSEEKPPVAAPEPEPVEIDEKITQQWVQQTGGEALKTFGALKIRPQE